MHKKAIHVVGNAFAGRAQKMGGYVSFKLTIILQIVFVDDKSLCEDRNLKVAIFGHCLLSFLFSCDHELTIPLFLL